MTMENNGDIGNNVFLSFLSHFCHFCVNCDVEYDVLSYVKCRKTGKLQFSANTVNDDIVEIPHANSGNSGNSENSRKYRN